MTASGRSPSDAPPRLMIPSQQLRAEIADRVRLGEELVRVFGGDYEEFKARREEFQTWDEYNRALLRRSFDLAQPADEYSRLGPVLVTGNETLQEMWDDLAEDVGDKLRRLRSLHERLNLFAPHPEQVRPAAPPGDESVLGEDVFIVHGHDEGTKATVARFLARLLGRDPVVLHEQADRGRTIIEKFEEHAARAACAVVLLTGDDLGGTKEGGATRVRARQNVVLECGFFIGKLGRGRVIILHSIGVELPSDLSGVLYTPLDTGGAWKNSLARELRAAGLEVDLAALIR